MEIVEIISYHQSENITEVTFRLMNDDEDMVRTDVIENSFFEEFGFDYLAPVTDWLFEEDSLIQSSIIVSKEKNLSDNVFGDTSNNF